MRDGDLICEYKGNSNWNKSSAHGSGRIVIRQKAFANIGLKEFEK